MKTEYDELVENLKRDKWFIVKNLAARNCRKTYIKIEVMEMGNVQTDEWPECIGRLSEAMRKRGEDGRTCDRCKSFSDSRLRLAVFWYKHIDEPRTHFLCDECFDEAQGWMEGTMAVVRVEIKCE